MKKAVVAADRSILVIIWNLFADPEACYSDLGADLREPRGDSGQQRKRGVRRAIRSNGSLRA